VFDAGHPRGAAFDAHAEAGVGDGAEASEVEVPFEGFLIEVVSLELFDKVIEIRGAFAAADDLAVAFGCEQVDAEGAFGSILVDFEIEAFDGGREMVDKYRQSELF